MNSQEQIRLMVHQDQKLALDRVANERGTTMQALLREAVAVITGVIDPEPPRTYRRKGPYSRKNR
jgi:hypothetical protein